MGPKIPWAGRIGNKPNTTEAGEGRVREVSILACQVNLAKTFETVRVPCNRVCCHFFCVTFTDGTAMTVVVVDFGDCAVAFVVIGAMAVSLKG